MKYISLEAQDQLMFCGLKSRGFPPRQAIDLVDSRWPLYGNFLLAECSGRGIELTMTDVENYLWEKFGSRRQNNETYDPATVPFSASDTECLLEWCSQKNQGKQVGLLATMSEETLAEIEAIGKESI